MTDPYCICCCRRKSDHNHKMQCPETTYFIENVSSQPPDIAKKEKSRGMSDRPIRVQLRRTKGWRMPENTVSVARPGPYGNPYKVGDPDQNGMGMAASDAVAAFRALVTSDNRWLDRIAALRGRNLACWCRPGDWCHADVLLELANSPSTKCEG